MRLLCAGLCFGLTLASVTVLAGDLTEGSPAPPLKVAKWVKGTPVTSFEPGKVYVVEFWATWCGPCLKSIPHLTELAKTFKGKVEFIGVNVWDKDEDATSTSYIARVDKWVKAKTDMDYNVCVDGVDDTMAKTWMTAANQNGIPAAFVIDQKGLIAWIGHPMAGLDKVLPQVIAGTFDLDTAKKLREADAAKQKEFTDALKSVSELIKAGKVDEGFAKLDALGDADPEFKPSVPIYKFINLAEADEKKAMALAHEYVFIKYDNDRDVLEQIGMYVCMNYLELKHPDYDLGIKALKAAIKIDKEESPTLLFGLANGTYQLGKKEEAIVLMKHAIGLLAKDPGASTKQMAVFRKKLAFYQSGK